MKIAFFIGSVDISGGTYVIYQHALYLQEAGHEVTLVVLYPYDETQMRWHPACKRLEFVPLADVGERHFDVAIATWWRTASELHTLNADRYLFFVQSIESRFYPQEEQPLRMLVDRTYDLELPLVTEATWIKQYLADRNGSDPSLVRNGIRKDLYCVEGYAVQGSHVGLRVLVEGPFGVAFKRVGHSLRIARRSRAASTWLLTSTPMKPWYPAVQHVFSRVPVTDVPAIYRSCDVLLKLSTVEGMFGPPLEMFHCGGTAIVHDVSGHDEYIVHNRNGIVIPMGDDQAVVDAIDMLASDRNRLQALKLEAIETARRWPDWNESSQQFLEVVTGLTTSPSREALRERNAASMAVYVEEENARLAALPAKADTKTLIGSMRAKYPRLDALMRHSEFIRESK